MFIFTGCEDNNDNPPTSGTLNITINVSNAGDWPSEGTVFCSLDKTWPPTGAPYKSVTLISSNVSNGVVELVFEDLDFDSIDAIELILKSRQANLSSHRTN